MNRSRSTLAMESSIHAIAQRPAESDEFADNVSQELLCVVCGSVLIDPRVLRCQHCFCLRCLFATVMHDRGSRVTVHCAYRCPEATVTDGDIRTLPRNTVITNLAQLVRDRTRKRLLQQQQSQSQSQSQRNERVSSVTRSRLHVMSTSPSTNDNTATSSPTATATAVGAVTTTATGDEMECEWCGSASTTITWCPYCLSQVCESCNGVFEDHYYLCVEQHVQRKPPKARATGSGPGAAASDGDNADDLVDAAGARDDAAAQEPLPFLFPECTLHQLLSNALRAEQTLTQREREPLTVTVESARPVRLSCQRRQVRYTHEVFGALCTYAVIPDGLTPFGKTLVTPAEVQWGAVDRGTTSLLFASNVVELTGHFLEHLAKAHAEVELARLELKSVARRAFVRHNLGFQAVVLHLASQYRNAVKVVQNCALPCLERGRALEGLMGDVVVSQFYQQWSQGSAMEKKTVQDRVASFLKTEMKLCESMDAMIEKLGKQCESGVALLERTLDDVSWCMRESIEAQEEYARNAAKCDHAQRRMTHGLPIDIVRPSDQARAANNDPIFNAYADRTFSGQWREKEAQIATVRNAVVGVLLHLAKLRHWVWDYTNTTVRDCGVSPADQTMLIEKEEGMQQLMDTRLEMCATHDRRTYAWEILFSHLESTKTPVTLDVIKTVCEYESHSLRALYSCENTLSLFAKLRDLREYLFQQSGNPLHIIQNRTFQRQEEIIDVMKTVISECMEEQKTALELIGEWESSEGTEMDELLHKWPAIGTEKHLPERVGAGKSDLDVLRCLVHLSDAEVEQLRVELGGNHRAIAADQYIRDLALHRSATFGAFLIDVAHGRLRADEASERLTTDGASPETEAATAAAPHLQDVAAGPAAAEERTPRVTPFLRSVPLTPSAPVAAAASPTAADTNAGGGAVNAQATLRAGEDPLQLPAGVLSAPDTRQVRRLLSTSSFSSVDSVGAAAASGGSLPSNDGEASLSEPAIDPAAMVSETLFAACDEPIPVARVELTPKASDPQGYEKAVRIFARHHHFSTVETTTIQTVALQLPFFEGVVCAVTASGESTRCRFLLDAQTGHVYIQKNGPVSKRTSLTTIILMSPFVIFAIFNLTLHPFLQVKATHVGWT